MKVVQFFYRIQDRGGEMHAARMARALAARGHEVGSYGFVRESTHGVSDDWVVLGPDGGRPVVTRLRTLAAVWRLLRTERPDVVITHTTVAGLLVQPLAALTGVRSRINIHHVPVFRYLHRAVGLAELVAGTSGAYTDIVMVAPSGVRSVARAPRRYRRRVRLVLNQVDPPARRDRAAARRRFGIDDDAFVLAYVGRLTEAKGALLAATAASAARVGPLLLAGGAGDASGSVAELEAAHPDIVRPLGHLDPDGLADVFAAADLLLFPSAEESRPLTVLEALGAGVPVLATDLPEIRETADELALYEPSLDPDRWADRVRHLAADPLGYGTVRRAVAAARPATLDDMLDEYLALMRDGGCASGPTVG